MGVPLILSEVPDAAPYIQYIAAEGQTVYPYPFPITQDSDLVVVVNGVTYNTDAGYSLSGQGNDTGGNVTLNTGSDAGDIVTLYRDIPIERLTQFGQNSGFTSTAFNAEFNNLYLIAQQLETSIGQCLQIPNTNDPVPSTTLAPGAYASKYLAFDSNGNPTPAVLTSSGSLTQQIIANLLTPQTPTEQSLSIVPVSTLYAEGNLLRYGADRTGVSSSWNALKNAVAVCQANGATVQVPAGNFLIDTANGTIDLSYVAIQGTGVTKDVTPPTGGGSVFSITGTTNSPFTIGCGVTFDGLGFYYPNQVDSASPAVYPPTIVTSLTLAPAGAINFVNIRNCTVFNAYRFFVDATTASGHVFVQNNTIYGILTAIELSYNPEIWDISDNEFTFGHWLAATEAGCRGYTRANGSVIKVTQTDGITFHGNTLFGYLVGLNVATSTSSGGTNSNGGLFQQTDVADNNFDQCLTAISVSGNGNVSLCTITGNNFNALNSQNHALIGNCVKITTSGTLTAENNTISSNIFSLCTGDVISVSGTSGRALTVTDNTFTNFGVYQASGTYSCLNINAANTSILASGNFCYASNGSGANLVGITATYSTGTITGNSFALCYEALNVSGFTIATGNQSTNTGATYANNYAFLSATIDTANKWDKNSLASAGWGIPVNGAVVASYNATTEGGTNTTKAVAQILTVLKQAGMLTA